MWMSLSVFFCYLQSTRHFKTGSFNSSFCCDFFYPLGKSKSCCAEKKIKLNEMWGLVNTFLRELGRLAGEAVTACSTGPPPKVGTISAHRFSVPTITTTKRLGHSSITDSANRSRIQSGRTLAGHSSITDIAGQSQS